MPRTSAGMTSLVKCSRLLASHPEDRQPEDQHEDIEQEAGVIRRCGRYAGEAENAGNDRDQEEQQRPSQNCHRPLLKPCDRQWVDVPCEIADLTSSKGTVPVTDGRSAAFC